ncbi:MAG: hypothetical protein SWO11_04500 [Thermodesulfobacteriota bacterium]|nr:hypothetical protein [Thermodesulfobacteriota bacterium]
MSPVLSILIILLIDLIEKHAERKNNYGEDIYLERKNRILKEAKFEINRELNLKPPCNKCDSKNVTLIIYGLVDIDEDLKIMIEGGKITLG